MKKVLFVNGSASPLKCGVGFYGERLTSELSASLDAHLLTTHPYGAATIANTKLHHTSKWGILSLPAICKKITTISPDVVHIQYPAVGFGRQLGINLLPLYLKLFYRKAPVVLTLHEYHSSALMGKIRTVITALFAKKIIVSNNSDKQALPSLLIKKKVAVIPIGSNVKKASKNPATLASLVSKYNLSKTLPTIVYFGFTNQAKGVLLLAESAANIKANVLLITELNPSDAYQKQVLGAVEKAKKDGASVAVTGYLSDTEVSEVLQESTLFVLPQPLPLTAKSGTTIAAVQHNVAVISTASLHAELNLPYINGNNAILLPKMESSALASTINTVLDSPAQLQTIKDNLSALQSYFSWNNIADEHVRLYNHLD